jgi:hypothetical protein
MRKMILVFLGFCALPLLAKDKPQYIYQDGVLVSFRAVATSTSCSQETSTKGNIDANTDDDGYTSGTVESTSTGSINCTPRGWIYYTIAAGGHTYVVHHAVEAWNRASDLHRQLPGAHVQVRFDKKGLYIRVGTKESKFVIVEAK